MKAAPRTIDDIQREIDEAERDKADVLHRLVLLHDEMHDAMGADVCRDAGHHSWVQNTKSVGKWCKVCGILEDEEDDIHEG